MMAHNTGDRQAADVSSPDTHLIERILYSRKPGMILLKYTLVVSIVVLGLANLTLDIQTLFPPYVYRKDVIQEYLLAKATLSGVNPYLPLSELAEQFIGSIPAPTLPHPTPHPPPVAILSLPLVLLTYEQAAVVWFLLEVACLFGSTYSLLRWLGIRSLFLWAPLIALMTLGWSPLQEGLILGQLMTFLLILLIGAWQLLRSGRDIQGGILLGCLIALRLILWPILIYLALRRNWRAVGAAGAIAIAANFVAALLMGFDRVAYYYLDVGASVSELYRNCELNFSAWALGWRFFDGTRTSVFVSLQAPPLIASPTAAHYASYVLPLVLLMVGLILAARERRFDISFGILICISLLISPVAWTYYITLASIPVVIVVRDLFTLKLPGRETYAAIVIGLLMSISPRQLHVIALSLAGKGPAIDETTTVPFVAGLVTLVPALAVLGLLWLVYRLDRACPTGVSQ